MAFCVGADSDNPGCIGGANVAGLDTRVPGTGGPVPYTSVPVPSNGLLPNPGAGVGSKARQNPLRFPTLDAWNLSFQRALSPTLSMTIAYVGNKGTNTLSDGDGNSTNPNEAAISLPGTTTAYGQSLSSYDGQSHHWDPRTALSPGITAGATGNQNQLQRYYGGSLPACSDPNYATPAGIPAGQCGWTQGIQLNGDDQNTNFNALQVTLAATAVEGVGSDRQLPMGERIR